MKKILLIFVIYFSTLTSSYAYLDPGTGSAILQVIIAALAAGAAMTNNFWKKVKGFYFKMLPSKKKGKTAKKLQCKLSSLILVPEGRQPGGSHAPGL